MVPLAHVHISISLNPLAKIRTCFRISPKIYSSRQMQCYTDFRTVGINLEASVACQTVVSIALQWFLRAGCYANSPSRGTLLAC